MSFLLHLSQVVKRLLPQASTIPAQANTDENAPLATIGTEDGPSALAAIQQRVPLLLVHGRAGAGKTTLIQRVRESGLQLAVVAPTGIVALTAKGQTIHSFFGIPPHIVNLEEIEPSNRLHTITTHLNLIIIDEISMVRTDLLDVVDKSLRVNRQSELPFGSCPIVLMGDFLQLPPITTEEYRFDQMTQRVQPVTVGTYSQLPIQPAWAITVHKSQGLALEDAQLDLGVGAFSTGQTYVALSRARSLDGLSFSRGLRVSDVLVDQSLVDGVHRMVSGTASF